LLSMMLVISIIMGIIPLAGIAWTIVTGTVTTVDGLFMSLILLTLSAVFFLNAFWELRDRGALAFLDKKKAAAEVKPPAPARATTVAKTTAAATTAAPPKPAPAITASAAPATKDAGPNEVES
jgi:hypothetical protein